MEIFEQSHVKYKSSMNLPTLWVKSIQIQSCLLHQFYMFIAVTSWHFCELVKVLKYSISFSNERQFIVMIFNPQNYLFEAINSKGMT